jgi:hypothetical protein
VKAKKLSGKRCPFLGALIAGNFLFASVGFLNHEVGSGWIVFMTNFEPGPSTVRTRNDITLAVFEVAEASPSAQNWSVTRILKV